MATKEELKEMFSTGKTPTGADFSALIDGVEGPKGATGATGATGKEGPQGPQGSPGTKGKDGFGTQTQYNDIIARLEALEVGD